MTEMIMNHTKSLDNRKEEADQITKEEVAEAITNKKTHTPINKPTTEHVGGSDTYLI